MAHDRDYTHWTADLAAARLPSNVKRELVEYITPLIEAQLPIILNLEHFSYLVGLNSEIISAIIYNSEKFYRGFRIPKRDGTSRSIKAPYPSLLHIQRWIVDNILRELPIDTAAHGFVTGRSIVTNASQHLKGKHLLKMDIKDFFPSIKMNRTTSIFYNLGYTREVSFFLGSMCCLNGELPQGSAASPSISNIVAHALDKRLRKYSERYSLTYTRYADDMAFSGNEITLRNLSDVSSIVQDEGFKVNTNKTVLIRGEAKKVLTGISISRGRLALPKRRKRELRQRAFFLIKKGARAESFNAIRNDPLYIDRIIGSLNFWHQIEPTNSFPIKALAQISKLA